MQCKKALEEAGGDMEKALVILEKKSKATAEKKSGRDLGAGVVQAYIHTNATVGAMVEVLCETDFVARNEEFQEFGYEIAMHIAAMNPQFKTTEDIDETAREKAKEVFVEEIQDKPEDMQEKILQGKMDSYFKDKVLMEQAYIKDGEKAIKDLVAEATQKFGERVDIGDYARFSI
ncbi:MAG: elongation factor Ts [Candidatus Paceibacterota bacterium]